jgi:hypothetical protein
VVDSTTFTYGPDRSRYQKVQTRSSDNTTITTQYFGKVYEKIKQNTSTEHKYFIYLDKQLIAIHIKTDTTSTADTSDTSTEKSSNLWVIRSTVHMYQPHLINVFVSSKASIG